MYTRGKLRLRTKEQNPSVREMSQYGYFYITVPGVLAGCYNHVTWTPNCKSCDVNRGDALITAGAGCRAGTITNIYSNTFTAAAKAHGILVELRISADNNHLQHMWDHTLGLFQMLYTQRQFTNFRDDNRYFYDPEIINNHCPLVHMFLLVQRYTGGYSGIFEDYIRIAGPKTIRAILESGDLDSGWKVFDRMAEGLAALFTGREWVIKFEPHLLREILRDRLVQPKSNDYSTQYWTEYQQSLERREERNATEPAN